jgi:hypothetical protein
MCLTDIHRSLDQVGLRGACWHDVSLEPGGKGSFQAVKLQRPARATVCSHSTRDIAATVFIESEQDHSDTQGECLSSCGQSWLPRHGSTTCCSS